MQKILLASSSPRRKKVLENLKVDFEVISSPYEEEMKSLLFDYKTIENLAYNKAFAVAKEIKERVLVVGADTVVVLDNKILGKPANREQAFEMLKMLAGKKHFVVTSICVIESFTMRKKINSTTSYVEFNCLSEELINKYIDEFKPLDKAGSYGIQELPPGFVKNISGSFDNIVGLCPKSLMKALSCFKD